MAATDMYVTPAGAGTKDGTTWANAMGLGEWETDLETNAEAGDRYFVAGGTYTLTQDISTALDGTSALPIQIIGVKSGTTNEPPVHSDHADGAARPLIAATSWAFTFDDYWIFQNLRLTITSIFGLYLGTYCIVQNCDINQSGAATRYAIYDTSDSKIIGCELQAVNGRAIRTASTIIIASYLHDSVAGVYAGADITLLVNSIIDTCTKGIDGNTRNRVIGVGNTIYNCSSMGISGTTGKNACFINNILDACAVGVDWTTVSKSNWFDYNCWNNTDDVADSDIVQGDHKVTGDPGMADPGNGDFTVTTGDAVANKALDVGDLTGATV